MAAISNWFVHAGSISNDLKAHHKFTISPARREKIRDRLSWRRSGNGSSSESSNRNSYLVDEQIALPDEHAQTVDVLPADEAPPEPVTAIDDDEVEEFLNSQTAQLIRNYLAGGEITRVAEGSRSSTSSSRSGEQSLLTSGDQSMTDRAEPALANPAAGQRIPDTTARRPSAEIAQRHEDPVTNYFEEVALAELEDYERRQSRRRRWLGRFLKQRENTSTVERPERHENLDVRQAYYRSMLEGRMLISRPFQMDTSIGAEYELAARLQYGANPEDRRNWTPEQIVRDNIVRALNRGIPLEQQLEANPVLRQYPRHCIQPQPLFMVQGGDMEGQREEEDEEDQSAEVAEQPPVATNNSPQRKPLVISSPAVPPANARTCIICATPKSPLDYPVRASAQCSHTAQACSACLTTWIAQCLTSRGPNAISCPECSERLAPNDVFAHSDADTRERYDMLLLRAAVSQLDDFVWCRASRCISGQLHPDGAQNPRFVCGACGWAVCVRCEVAWHEGEDCAEYEARTSGTSAALARAEAERRSRALIEETAKKCPGPSCNHNIEKTDGCDHMTCAVCFHEFCWVCLCSYDDIRVRGNQGHAATCRYHG